MRGLATEECDSTQQHCALRWSDSATVGNMTLEFVRASLDAPRRKGASSSHEEAHRLDMQCYVGRHRYASVNAYHHSQSLSALAMELYRSHHDGVHPALRPTQSHHRLKRLVQQRVEQQQSDVDEEDDVMRDLEKEVSGRYAGPSSLFRDLVISSASPAAPFLSPVEADRRIERGVDHGAGGLGLPDAPARTLMTFHGVPGTPSAPKSALHDTFTIPGDLVVARYIRTNNWKYCRNVQHGLYFNMSHKSSDPFFENRCLVAQWLTDVCWVVDQSSTDASQWSVVGGCASNTGAAFQYTSLRDNRNDAHGHAKNADHGSQWIPLSVRVCVRSDVDKERPMSTEGQPTGASFTSSAGTVVPSFEFIRRLVLEVFEQQRPRQGGLVAAERLITFDWRDATYSGLRIPDPPSMSAVWWSLAAFLTIMIVFVLAVKFC
ncbi:transmembrane protein, putative [Bodo saltans]|uniref:Transmembrane protein, putative n=1 Tax=Bodo saltans TaxID=75058 RepID=A0A0S4J5M0_BODSA|nr:transmembrane protein, putative [Bodo saltans]|eukprot:CUG61620.1 transmembrane protein, putative [Bodo saltans]